MRVSMMYQSVLMLFFAAVSTAPAISQVTPAADKPLRAELALDYSYLRSNVPPGGCGCFALNGGSATFAWQFKPHVSLVGDVYAGHVGSITYNGSETGLGLTLSAYTVGARYRTRLSHKKHGAALEPFGQVLLGVAHASGSLAENPNPAASNADFAFAANMGGGLDGYVNRRISFRLVEADYLLTTFDNGSNDHQNNLRLSAGIVLRF